MKVLILYPNNPSARGLAVRLLETGHDVSLFCPSERDMKNAQNITDELSFIATEQQRFRGTNFSVHEGFNIQSFEFLGKSPHRLIVSYWVLLGDNVRNQYYSNN